MNHKQLAEDHYETSQHVTNGDIAARHLARAQYHATMAQLEALDAIAALLTKEAVTVDNGGRPDDTVSIEELRREFGL